MPENALIEYNGEATLPEGLYLAYYDTINYEPAIFDAQDMVWVHFPDHDTEDPLSWFAGVILSTCKGLGVTRAIDESTGEEVSVQEFVKGWCGWHEGEPGFTT